MSSIYSNAAKIAADLLTDFKQGNVAIIRKSAAAGPAYNPDVPTTTNLPVNAVARGVSKKYVDGALILASDLQITIPTTTLAVMGDRISIDSIIYDVVAIKNIPAAGTPVAQVIIIRR